METLTLNKKQKRRAEVLGRLFAGGISKLDAENLLGLTRRQINRLLNRYSREGIAAALHGNSGRTPANKIDELVRERIIKLADKDGKYKELNTCHMADLLLEDEDIKVGRPTLYRLLKESRLIKPGREKQAQRRGRRERSAREGMMLQIDGSQHDWLCGRGPRMTLMGAIDDAKGEIVYLNFRPTEDQAGYLMMMRSIAVTHGLPECFYHDRHTILHSPADQSIEDELAGKEPQSQVQRVMSELGIASIPAHSPQAKGRIERLWKTLQDRLIKEMSIAGISSISEANAFLPGFIKRFNARFGKAAAESESAWVEIEPDMDMHYYFSTSEQRTVKQDHTISWLGTVLQILKDEKHPLLAGKRVDVKTSPEREIKIYTGKRALPFKEAAPRTVSKPKSEQPKPAAEKPKTRRKSWLYQRTAA